MSRILVSAKEGMVYWKLAITNALLYALIACGGAWLSSTSSITAEQWAAMSSFDKWKIYIGIALVGFGIIRAFLDKTMSELRDDKEDDTVPPPTKAP